MCKPRKRKLRHRLAILIYGELLMDIADKVDSLVTGQAAQATALQAIATQLTALQSSVAAIPTTALPPVPATTSPPDVLEAVAAVDAKVTTVIADLNSTPPAPPATPPGGAA